MGKKMALDMDKEFDRHQKGWESFAKILSLSTIAVLIIVGLMALTLV